MSYSILRVFEKCLLVKNGSVFNIKLDSKSSIQPQTIVKVKEFDLQGSEKDGSVIVLSVKMERGLFLKKRRRKRYQRKVGFRKSVLTLKHIT